MEESGSGTSRIAATMESSQLVRVAVVGGLVLALQIPIFMIDAQIAERQATRDQAVAEVTGLWGGAQRIVGPALRVPWRERRQERNVLGATVEQVILHHATFLPRELEIHAEATGETRHRGIFDVPLYQAEVVLIGVFERPDFAEWDVADADVLWDRAELLVGVEDSRALRAQPSVQWKDAPLSFEPGGPPLAGEPASLRARVPDAGSEGPARFRVRLYMNGANRIAFSPVGRTTTAGISSNWPHPSFEGRWLPTDHTVEGEGFDAEWQVSHIGRGYPQQWRDHEVDPSTLRHASFGVGFLAPVDPYRMAERSVKYGTLFLGLPFLAIWLFEVLTGLRVHPIQYLFVGGALCVFYLLQLSFAEHLGFSIAYALAASAVATMVTLYGRAILGAGRRAAVLGGLVIALYGLLYVLLREQDYALLLGSIGLFAALAVAMWITRDIDWYRLERTGPGGAKEA